ncbi:hypothetical protein JHN63_27365 [Streptomyces sp. MBT65]|uniref:hypothetical protein n=1 Tax=Streptomyces sp. MBT65 TaxID=1488395 RepID=UPI00190BF378|nr:hypothetical protein [Streptomyces sp. MBT65]MBK3577453.1 hypothetical protein [Streptomyces sp. MBT65]
MGIPSRVSGTAAAEGLGEPLGRAVVRRAPRLLGGRPVYLYEEGFVLGPGARVRRWADVTHWRSTVDVIVVANERHDVAWYTLSHRHLLRFGDGDEQGFVLDERQVELGVTDAEPPENRRMRSAVVDRVRQRVADAQVPAMLDRIEHGGQVAFGPLTADADQVFLPGGRQAYRWADLQEPRLAVELPDFPVPASWWLRPRDVPLSLRCGDGRHTDLPAWEVVNRGALVALWKRLNAR